MMEEKKISIIVPAYNIVPYLQACLDSLLGQSYPNLEILVVDDGSTDGTGELAERCAEKDPRITVIRQANGGVTAARFAGLERASGAYVGFVDGDDTAEPDMFETLLKDAERYGADIAHCGYQMVFPDGHVDRYYGTGRIVEQDREQGIVDLLEGQFVEPGLCNKLYRRTLFSGIMEDERMDRSIRINEDLLLNFLLFSRAERCIFRDVCSYHYQLRPGSAATSAVQPYKLLDPQRVAALLFEATREQPRPHAAACRRYIRVLVGNAAQKELPEVEAAARKALREQKRSGSFAMLPAKERYMALGVLYARPLYRMVRRWYDRATGNDRKYRVE